MKWIAIKDQLPPAGNEVLFWADDWYELGFVTPNGKILLANATETNYIKHSTHWAEITPPEIGESK